MTEIILGAGSSGLIAHFYRPETKIISKDIGGMARYSLGPRNIFVNKETAKLLNELRLHPKVIKKKLGFFYNDEFHSKIPLELKKLVISKKLQDCKNKIKNMNIKEPTWGSENRDNFLKVYDLSFMELIDKLMKNVKKTDIIKKEVALIDLKAKTLVTKDFHRHSFDKLISTIPMPEFRYLCFNHPFRRDFLYAPVTFAFCDKLPAIMRKDNDYDLIYVPEKKFKYHRISKIDGNYVHEFSGDLSKDEVRSYLDSDVKILNYTLQRVGVIFGEPMKDLKDVMFLSRLASWVSDIRIENVIKKILVGNYV